jgi:UDP-N-acetylglucosamine/UDP-N-acetylgalactosamine diphosphorylase
LNDELREVLARWNQEHLLAFWDRLDPPQRERLARQIRALDFAQLRALCGRREAAADFRALAERAGPPPAVRLDARRDAAVVADAVARGEKALRAGRVAALLVAGGQGTRLGFDRPKGMYPIGPVSGSTLFQIHVEKLVARSRRYGRPIPLCLMTSPATHAETVEFFAAHDRFGLAERDLRIFCQGTMPAVDEASGRVLLAAPDELALSPDGHGGTLAALVHAGLLDELERRGIEHLFYFQVDNPLVDVAAPEFLGHHLAAGSEMTTQVVAKRDPLEKVGNVVEVDGRVLVIEYSDLPDDVAIARSREIWAGSIGIHAIEIGFLRRMAGMADALPFHVARKKVAHVDPSSKEFPPPRIEPAEPNAVKFERFIFDLIPYARGAIVVEIDRAEGFAPLKNASGAAADTPETARDAMIARHRRWLEAAGAEVAPGVPVEIAPLWALDEAEVRSKIAPGTRIAEASCFAPP